MGRIQDLPLETISLITKAVSADDNGLQTLKSLSGTCSFIRAATLPRLWNQAKVNIDFKDLETGLRKMHALSMTQHPLHTHARRLDVTIGPQYEADGPFDIAELDSALASTILNFGHLVCLHVHGHSPGFSWPRTMQAIVELGSVEELVISGCMPINLPPVGQQTSLKRFTMTSTYGPCSVNLASYPTLQELTVAMEDIEPIRNWDRLLFPAQLWKQLTSLRLRGYCRQPSALLSKISDSLQCINPTPLKSLELRLMREPYELDQALETFQDIHLTSLALTLPFLPDAPYCDGLAKAYPDLTELMLSGLCHNAAWMWPDTPLLYAKAFSAFRTLRVLAINHIEEDGWDMANDDDNLGPKVAYVPSEEGLQRRQAFASTIIKHGRNLQSVGFLPDILDTE